MPWIADLVLLAALWGGSFLLMKLGATEFGPIGTAFLRVALASVLLLALVAARGQLTLLKNNARHMLAVGLLNSALPFALFSFAVLALPTGLASILNATTPLWGALVAALWLGDRLSLQRVLGMALGLGGVLMLSWDRINLAAGGSGWAVLACLGATLCYGIAASYTKRFLPGVAPLVTATGSQLGATLALAIPAAFLMPGLTGPAAPGLRAWGALVAVAVLCTALAYILFFRLIQNAGPQRALTVTFLVPVFGVAYGSLFMHEAITPRIIAGGLTIVIGTALSLGLLGRKPAAGAVPAPHSSQR
jgi:drug/metabolite transporter (DMT)-like permease